MKFMKLGSKPDSFHTDDNDIRYVAAELATDIIVHVGDVKFYLHKFPLLSKSARLQKIVSSVTEENGDEIYIPDIPGGAHAFEICAKFCYGMTVTLNAYNVVAARCAAEYLEMQESVEKGNLVHKIEVFLNASVFRSWKDSIIVLQTTKAFLPWSEDLKIVGRCIESIASKATVDTSKVEWSYTYNRKKLISDSRIEPEWNGVRKVQSVPKDWWVEDISELEMDLYKRMLVTIKTKNLVPNEVIGEALKVYAFRRLPGFGEGAIQGGDSDRNCSLVETLVWLLPREKGSVSCSFLFRLLKCACFLGLGEVLKKELITRIAKQLDQSSVKDLLIPAAVGEDTLYDVDLVQNMVEMFMVHEQNEKSSVLISEGLSDARCSSYVTSSSKLAVAKLIDAYLAEIARDPHLPLSKFFNLAELFASESRPVHDGIYRAIDMYLKEHPGLSKSDKKRICRLMDCRKLSQDACMHAVQNERLPLRVVVQVLFFEQVRSSILSNSSGTELPPNIRPLATRESGCSRTSSRSATTNTEEDWDASNLSEHLKSGLNTSMRLAKESSDKSNEEKASSRAKSAVFKPKMMLNKLWSTKGSQHGENSSSDTSKSPRSGSVNREDSKSTPSRNRRHSVS